MMTTSMASTKEPDIERTLKPRALHDQAGVCTLTRAASPVSRQGLGDLLATCCTYNKLPKVKGNFCGLYSSSMLQKPFQKLAPPKFADLTRARGQNWTRQQSPFHRPCRSETKSPLYLSWLSCIGRSRGLRRHSRNESSRAGGEMRSSTSPGSGWCTMCPAECG